ncbi:hypothetical protein [Frigidibacter sp. ROC022]|uniref:hypothetical protein n=1 Tax=Frigidibacter sp. ROC022 TaxID=2971796 RepID=UPI00215B07CB|nr:hypothetical protein [Frigidibacter sp. ROC022]MCR8725426.1 hypothetical protein [Frigidibacter sp. ROC022]
MTRQRPPPGGLSAFRASLHLVPRRQIRQSGTGTGGKPLLEAINAYLDSVWWTATTSVVGIAGVMGLVLWLIGMRDGWRRWFIRISLSLLGLSVLFSMLFEELIPLALRDSPRRAIETGIAQALFAIATVLFAIGGARFVRDTQTAFVVPQRTRRKAGYQPPRWWNVWRPGLRRMGGGVLVFVLASVLYNSNRFPLNVLSAWF